MLTFPNWHRLRKFIHLACFLLFLALPFLNIVRFDIPKQRFYFAGIELWINEFAIIFFSVMFLMFVVVVSSVFYGRVYCGYLCPQMIFSEASVAVEKWLRRRFPRAVFYLVLGVASVFLAFAFIAYFVEPRDLLRSLITLDIHTAAGISGAAVTVLTFLDFTLVRQRFCTTVCPYGYLQGMLSDSNTLLVHYRDQKHDCIECQKCVRVCPMGIDIRKSPFQIECIHCAECIDACDAILARLKRPGLIHYTWGEGGPVAAGRRQPWDARRIVVLLILALYAAGLTTALAMRRPVLVRVSPVRNELYRIGPDGRVYNQFRYAISNRSRKQAAVLFSIQQLPGGQLAIPENPVAVQPGESRDGSFEISAPAHGPLVTHFSIMNNTAPGQPADSIPMTFLSPGEKQ
jgi:cytochrome c oxidase accessory protein FixG